MSASADSYYVCGKCGHQVTVAQDQWVDRCEKCGAAASWGDYFDNPDKADEMSEFYRTKD